MAENNNKISYEELKKLLGFEPNDQKEAAIRAVDGKTLLLAVPGSGKTTALVARLGYMLLCRSVEPSSILTMTYTVAAAADMKARFASLFGEELASKLEFKTINAVCYGIIGYYSRTVSGKSFKLCEDDRSSSPLLPQIYKEITGEYPTESDLGEVRSAITYAKNMMLTDDELKKKNDIAFGKFYEIFTRYRAEMRARELMDFDDQMIYALSILKRYPQVLSHYREKYKYICVDEAQDTSLIQHKIIALLTGEKGNLFMVGDEDQSIYGFRAAYPKALTGFREVYPGSQILFMEDNYRSAPEIVASADGFVRGNLGRYPKIMRASSGNSGGIVDIRIPDRYAQYTQLLKMAKNVRTSTAVLYRENECALPLIDIFERNGVDYTLKASDFTFFSHRIVREIIAALKLTVDGKDTASYMQVCNRIQPFLKRQDAERVCKIAIEKNLTVYDAIGQLEELEPFRQKNARIAGKLIAGMKFTSPDKAINSILENLGYRSSLERAKVFSSKPDVLETLAKRESTVGSFLWRLSELERIIKQKLQQKLEKRQEDAPDSAKLVLSTVHMAKGLEYDSVWLLDAIDSVTPGHSILRDMLHNSESRTLYEEERRIFYVAVTRAKKALYVFYSRDIKARFVDELLERRAEFRAAAKKSAEGGLAIPGNFVDGTALRLGMRVRHAAFGDGTVTGRTQLRVTVFYDCGEIREYVAAAARFELI